MEEIIPKKFTNYLIKNKVIIIYSFIIAIICYGYELFNFSLSIDEEVVTFLRASEFYDWVCDGRWGTYLTNLFFARSSVIPYFPTLISILSIAVSGFLYINNETEDLPTRIVFCTIFITYPLHSYYLAFNMLSVSLGFGLILSVLSFIIIKEALTESKINYWKSALSIAALLFSISIYQGTITIFVLLTVTHLFFESIKNESFTLKILLKKAAPFLLVFIISLIGYKLIDIVFKHIFEEKIQGRNYIENFKNWGKLPVKTIIYSVIGNTILYFTDRIFYGGYAIYSIFIIVPFILFQIIRRIKKFAGRILTIFLLIAMVMTPFLIMYIFGTFIPPRSMLALPFMIAILWFILYRNISEKFKKIVLGVTFIVLIGNTYCTTRLFYSAYTSWQADRDMANRIIERIYSLELPVENEKIPIAFIGKYQFEENQLFMKTKDVFGASFFEWDNGNPYRMNLIFNTVGENHFQVVIPNENNGLIEKSMDMPDWPYKGSVVYRDGVVVVKLSEENQLKK